MKTTLIAAAALLAIGTVPALAAEGNGEPFGLVTPGVTTTFGYAANGGVNSYAYVMRPGLDNEISGQSLNSLPAGAMQSGRDYVALGSQSYAQAVQTASLDDRH